VLALVPVAPDVGRHGPGACGTQGHGGVDRIVACAAHGLEVELAGEFTRVACGDGVVATAAVRAQIRLGAGGDRTGYGEGHGVVAAGGAAVVIVVVLMVAPVALHVGLQRPRASSTEGHGRVDRVVAGAADRLEVEVAVQFTGVAGRNFVGPVAAVRPQISLAAGGDRAGDGEGERVVALAALYVGLHRSRTAGG